MPAQTPIAKMLNDNPEKARKRLDAALARGGTGEDIAARLGLSRRALFRLLGKLGISLGPRGVKPSSVNGIISPRIRAEKRQSRVRELSPDPSAGDRS